MSDHSDLIDIVLIERRTRTTTLTLHVTVPSERLDSPPKGETRQSSSLMSGSRGVYPRNTASTPTVTKILAPSRSRESGNLRGRVMIVYIH